MRDINLVCSDCIGDDYLANQIRENSSETHCDYCGSDNCNSVSLDFVMEIITPTVHLYWEDAANSVSYETREGGYQETTYSSREILWDLIEGLENEDLRKDIADELGDTAWVLIHRWDEDDFDRWSQFCEIIKHEKRFFFSDMKLSTVYIPDEDEHGDTVSHFLRRIIGHLKEFNRVQSMPAGTSIIGLGTKFKELTPQTP